MAGLTSKTNGFQVVLAGGGQALKLAAESPEVAAEWKQALTSAIEGASAMHTVTMQGEDFVIDEHYTLKQKVGAGAYGMVVAGVDTKNVAHNEGLLQTNPSLKGELEKAADDPTAVMRIKDGYGFRTENVAIKKVRGQDIYVCRGGGVGVGGGGRGRRVNAGARLRDLFLSLFAVFLAHVHR